MTMTTIDGEFIVNLFKAKPPQPLLFEDHDYTLRNTPFQDSDFNKEILAYWWMCAYVPDGYAHEKTPYEIYTTWSNAVYRHLTHVTINGYLPEYNQSFIKLIGYSDKPLKDHMDELNLFLPFIKYNYIGILEHTLSEHGIYRLNLNPIQIEKTTYGSTSIIQKFDTLEDAVDFIRINLPYERSSTNSYSDDYDEDGEDYED